MLREKKIHALRTILGDGKIKGNEIVFFCPKHGASQDRTVGQLSINLDTDKFHCWSCGFGHPNLVPILRMNKRSPIFREYLDEISLRPVRKEEQKKYEIPSLPPGFVSLSERRNSYHHNLISAYLKQRGICFEDIVKYKLGYTESGDYRNRVIFPSFDEKGSLNFMVGRDVTGKSFVKYKHGEYDKDIIFNDYMINWNRPIYLTEGPFDMLKIEENGIPIQGNALSESSKLFSKIVTSGVPTYFALDDDAFKKQFRIIRLFLSYGVSCHYVSVKGYKDVGEMGKSEFLYRAKNAIAVNTESDLFKIAIMRS